MIRKANESDLDRIVKIHMDAFPGYFMTELGKAFMFQYYKTILLYNYGIVLVYEDEQGIVGFVTGFYKPNFFYKRLKLRKFIIGVTVLMPLIKNPRLCYRLLSTYRRTDQNTNRRVEEHLCELSSIGVMSNLENRGVGQKLVHAFINEAKKYGPTSVYLYTDVSSNDRVNLFYQKLNFNIDRSFESFGNRNMYEYRYNL